MEPKASTSTLPTTTSQDAAPGAEQQRQPAGSAPPKAAGIPRDSLRIRHLRACDRCRRRKVKCEEEAPCARCRAAKTECTFNLSSRILSSDTSQATEGSAPSTTRKKRKAEGTASSSTDAKAKAGTPAYLLDHDETSSYFFTAEGLARFCGSTSGLPLLEATRRLSKLSRLSPANTTATAEPDWAFLDQLLTGQPAQDESSPDAPSLTGDDDLEFFPDRETLPKNSYEAHNLVVEIIPPDLLGELMHIFFQIIHPQWPILHIPSILNGSDRWREPAFAALIVSMCMLASRYCADERVRMEADNPVTAGYHYFALFRKLRDMASLGNDDAVEAIQSLFFAAQYHCVDTLPHPIAQGLLADAIVRCYDGGFHRTTSVALGEGMDQEIMKRTAWACFIMDKQVSAITGRAPLMRLNEFDVGTPSPFNPPLTHTTTPEEIVSIERDAVDCQIFKQLVLIAAVTEKAMAACGQPPTFDDDDFLDWLGGRRDYQGEQDYSRLVDIEKMLERWVRELPPILAERSPDARFGSPTFSPQTEAVLALEACCRIMLASRRLHLTTANITANGASKLDRVDRAAELRVELKKHRLQLLSEIKQLIQSSVKLGAAGLLWRCDIFNGYRLLMAGRLTLAVVLSAQEDNDSACETEAIHTLEACLLLLKHFAASFPTSIGAAETLKETCRVCNVHLSKAILTGPSFGKYAWHRPLPRKAATVAAPAPPSRDSGLGSSTFPQQPHQLPLPDQPNFTLPPPSGLSPSTNSTTMPLPFQPPTFGSPSHGGFDTSSLFPPPSAAAPTPGNSAWLDMLAWTSPGGTVGDAQGESGNAEASVTGTGVGTSGLPPFPSNSTPGALGGGQEGDWAAGMGDFSWLYPGGDMLSLG
ncbi:fungal-specific transcription factor domain-domain-containing protein [Leucosporidium creatinivorum]|uniref:Fungal-specific transcription factor domain-domain-containing protein n=1 Tax=Leucosporidium creatinivorum TaxID=106004 RepID=A0A1Y2FJA0_9BASI|nr:fungal-specific transcription factor domain-domain-containing protein [Leucosporidium creatinivorum]